MLHTRARRSSSSRRGITFPQIVLSISAAAICVGLLLPAVQKVRAAATRMTTVAALRPLGVQVLAHAGQTALLEADSLTAVQQILRGRDVAAGNLEELIARYDDALAENARLLDLVDTALENETNEQRIDILTEAQEALEDLEDALTQAQAKFVELDGTQQ